MEGLEVFLFGKFRIRFADQELEEISSTKVQDLFCYLLLNRDRPHCRESLANILWDNTSTVQSKRYLRRALWRLQGTLSTFKTSSKNTVLLIDGDWIQLNPSASIWVDAIWFEQSCKLSRGIPGQHLDNETALLLCKAIQLYKTHLLDNRFHDWCLFERERFRQLFLSTLDKLMLYFEANGKYEEGIRYGLRILRYDQAREHTHRRLMRLYFLSGNRTEALRQYEKCKSILNNELGIKPAPITYRLYEEICTGRFIAYVLNHDNIGLADHNYLQNIEDELYQIRDVLTNIQRQVEHQIEVVESVIDKKTNF